MSGPDTFRFRLGCGRESRPVCVRKRSVGALQTSWILGPENLRDKREDVHAFEERQLYARFYIRSGGIEDPIHSRKFARIETVLAAKRRHSTGGRRNSEHIGPLGDHHQVADSWVGREVPPRRRILATVYLEVRTLSF